MKKLLLVVLCLFIFTFCSACTEQENSNAKENASEIFSENSNSEQEQSEMIASSESEDSSVTELEKEDSSLDSGENSSIEISVLNNLPKYELESITEKRYEKNDSFIEFYDLPENDAETIVCYDLLYQITGNYERISEFQYSVPEEYHDESAESSENSSMAWIKVNQVSTMSFEELTECDDYDALFEQLRNKLSPNIGYDDYVKMILDNGCVVVSIKYSDKYTEEVSLQLPQISDGDHEEYWLFVPDQNDQLRIFDSTRYYGYFNLYDDDNVPNSLIVRK